MNFLFWNAGKRAIRAELTDLIDQTNANFIALAEFIDDDADLLRELNRRKLYFAALPTIGCKKIRIFVDFPLSAITHRRETTRYTIKEIVLPGHAPLLVALVHLPSKLQRSEDDQQLIAMDFKRELEQTEMEANHRNTIAFGDFNMNPFDKGMTSAGAMNSLPCSRTASIGHRTFSEKKYSFFYNPSWNLLGDFDEVPGTYFHGSPSSLSHYWNTLDQVILRPDLASRFDKKTFKIITSAGATSLVGATGRPKASDHLPIFFSLALP